MVDAAGGEKALDTTRYMIAMGSGTVILVKVVLSIRWVTIAAAADHPALIVAEIFSPKTNSIACGATSLQQRRRRHRNYYDVFLRKA